MYFDSIKEKYHVAARMGESILKEFHRTIMGNDKKSWLSLKNMATLK